MHVTHDDGFARIQRRAAQPLSDRETWIRRWLAAGFGENHEFVFDDLVNGEPPITTRVANHLYELFHSFSGAAPGQRKRPDLLQLFASGFLHSRGGNLAQKETKREHVFNFLRPTPVQG